MSYISHGSYYRPQITPHYGHHQPRYGIFPGEGGGHVIHHPRDGYDFGPGYTRNFQNVNTGGRHWGFWGRRNKGYGIDLNRNGRFNKGRDGVLVFDMNRDGKYDKRDVRRTNNMMKAVTGNYDLNGDGYVSFREARRGRRLRNKYMRMDRNRDGVLDKWEMSRAGGKVWVDRSRGGGVGRNELHSVWNLPGKTPFGPSQRLDFVDPFAGVSHTSNNWGHRHHGGYHNGYPGGGGGWAWAGGTPGFYN